MNKTSRIGIVIVVLLLVGGIYFYQYNKRTKTTCTYYGYYDNVQGLANGSPIHLRGVQIGKVTDMQLEGERIRVTFTIPDHYRLNEGCTAVLVAGTSLLDNKSIQIQLGDSPKKLPNGAQIQTAIDPTMVDNFSVAVAPAIEQGKVLLKAMDTGLVEFMHVVTAGLTTRFMTLTAQWEAQTNELAQYAHGVNQQSRVLSQTIQATSKTLRSLSVLGIDSSIRSAQKNTDQLAQVAIVENTKNMSASIAGIKANMERIKQSSWVESQQKAVDLSHAIDTLTRNMQELQADPPGISIFSKKKK